MSVAHESKLSSGHLERLKIVLLSHSDPTMKSVVGIEAVFSADRCVACRLRVRPSALVRMTSMSVPADVKYRSDETGVHEEEDA